MKTTFILCLSFLFFLNLYKAHAQKKGVLIPFKCGTVGSVNTSLHYSKVVPLSPTSCHYIKVHFHIIRHTNGTGGIPVSDLGLILTHLNNGLNPRNIVVVKYPPY